MVYLLNAGGLKSNNQELVDLGKKFFGDHAVTISKVGGYKDGKPFPMDCYYCDPKKGNVEEKTLDYIFVMKNTKDQGNMAKLKDFKVNVNKFTAEEGKEYNQLSDHWGVEASIDIDFK